MKLIKKLHIFVLVVVGAVAGTFLPCCASENSTGSEHGSGKLIPRSVLFGNPQRARASLSPDGKQLAYLAPSDKNVLNIWVRALDQSGSDRQITSDETRDIRSIIWQYDNAHLLYVQDRAGDENYHLFQVSIETGETRDLTPFEGVRVSVLDYLPEYPETALIQMNKNDPGLFDIYRVDLRSGELELDTPNFGQVFDWIADHHLCVRAARSHTEGGEQVVWYRKDGQSDWQPLVRLSSLEDWDLMGFTPSERGIYAFTNRGRDRIVLCEYDLKTGKERVIASHPKFDLGGVHAHPTRHHVVAVSVQGERPEWIVVDKQQRGDFDFLYRQFGPGFAPVSQDLSDRYWVVGAGSDIHPCRYYLYDRKQQTCDLLFSSRPDLEEHQLAKMDPVRFLARDGMILYGYLTVPVGGASPDSPAVLFVHGGPWARDTWGYNPYVQWLANRGYVVLQVNFRGSKGYGKRYLDAGNKEWGGKMQDDISDGKEWLVRKGYAHPDKVAIFGGSYGGYATLAGLAFTPEMFCCGVDYVGPSNLETLLRSHPPYWSSFLEETKLRLGDLEKDKGLLKERSPLTKVHQICRPLFVSQGANDPRVKQAESDQIVQAMRARGLPVTYLLFPDEGHGCVRPHNKQMLIAASESFLAEHLHGSLEPVAPSESWEKVVK